MSDVRRCDLCTRLGDAEYDQWYTVNVTHEVMRLDFNDRGPWHFDTIMCMAQWAEDRANQVRLAKEGHDVLERG